jgi:putative cardiolipin synthase
VQIGETGALEWVEQADSSTIVHPSEPGAGAWRRAAVTAASLLPIDWLL